MIDTSKTKVETVTLKELCAQLITEVRAVLAK